MCPISGFEAIGIIGFGMPPLIVLTLTPRPAQRTIACRTFETDLAPHFTTGEGAYKPQAGMYSKKPPIKKQRRRAEESIVHEVCRR
jgi:hypothetical protein